MKINLTLISILYFVTTSFAQTLTQTDTEKSVCNKVLKATSLLKEYIKNQRLSAAFKAVKILDTAQILIQNINKDSLVISSEDFTKMENIVMKIQKLNYNKILTDEKKAPKVKVKLEGEVYFLSKNNFMPLYTFIRILENLFDDWYKKL